jgi:hypothetical protein
MRRLLLTLALCSSACAAEGGVGWRVAGVTGGVALGAGPAAAGMSIGTGQTGPTIVVGAMAGAAVGLGGYFLGRAADEGSRLALIGVILLDVLGASVALMSFVVAAPKGGG